MSLTESILEDAALTWFGELGYAVGHGPDMASGEAAAERDSFREVVLVGRLRAALRQINPKIPEEAREEALSKVLRLDFPSLVSANLCQFRTLATLQDPASTVRPKQLSGELSVREANKRTPKWMTLTESIVEEAALEWFGELGYAFGHGPHVLPGEPAAERGVERGEFNRTQP